MYQNLEQLIEEKVAEVDRWVSAMEGELNPPDKALVIGIKNNLRTALRQAGELTVDAIFVDKLPTTVPGAILEAGYWLNKE